MDSEQAQASKRRRLIAQLEAGKTLVSTTPLTHPSGEPATLSVSAWKTSSGFRLSVERYLDRHVMCEQLYFEDRLVDVDSVAALETYLTGTLGVDWLTLKA